MLLAPVERAARDAGQLVSGGHAHFDRARLALHHRHVDERRHPHVGIGERDERHDVGEHPRLARGGDRRAVAHRPPHFSRRAGVERGLDDRSSAARRPFGDESGRQMQIRLIARHVDRRARGPGRRYGQHERRAARRGLQRSTPFERERKRRRSRQKRGVRVSIGNQRHGPAGGVRVHERRAGQQAHAADAGAQHVAAQIEDATRRVALDAHAQIGAREHRRDGRHGRALRRTARQINQPIVFAERQRDGPRRVGRPRRLGRSGPCERCEDRECGDCRFRHVSPRSG